MEDKKYLYKEETKKLELEDLESVAGGVNLKNKERRTLKYLYIRLRQTQDDLHNNRTSGAEYAAAVKELCEYRQMLMEKYGCSEEELDHVQL